MAVVLRPGAVHTGHGPMVIRKRWPEVAIAIRGGSGFALLALYELGAVAAERSGVLATGLGAADDAGNFADAAGDNRRVGAGGGDAGPAAAGEQVPTRGGMKGREELPPPCITSPG